MSPNVMLLRSFSRNNILSLYIFGSVPVVYGYAREGGVYGVEAALQAPVLHRQQQRRVTRVQPSRKQ